MTMFNVHHRTRDGRPLVTQVEAATPDEARQKFKRTWPVPGSTITRVKVVKTDAKKVVDTAEKGP